MSRIIKMGIAAGKICLEDAQCPMPDAIITGTGFGCIEDTEKFLTTMIRNNEELLTPTSFIQSTHNTVSAQIALLLKCHNYNFTYVHRGASFESAMLDARVRMDDGLSKTVLLGGLDELTNHSFRIMERMGHWKRKPVNNISLLSDTTRGTIAGEGASFFLLASEPGVLNYGKISGLDIFTKPSDASEVRKRIEAFIEKCGLTADSLDLVVTGRNGDPAQDKVYNELDASLFSKTPQAVFKHLCGEYMTASAFALWLSAMILKNQSVPGVCKWNERSAGKLQNILIVNHYRNYNYSLILLKSV
jgi:3-oxoacyl-(acyl-carrier-protein) synthase